MENINKPFPDLEDASAEKLIGMVWWLASELSADWEPWQLVSDAEGMWEAGRSVEEYQQSKWYTQQYESGNIWRAVYVCDYPSNSETIEICYSVNEAIDFLREEKAAKRLQVMKGRPRIQCPGGLVIEGNKLRKLIRNKENDNG